jgi:hypothetical protein
MAIVGKGIKRRVEALLTSLATSWKLDDHGGLTSQDPEVFSTESALVQILDSSGALTGYEFESCAKRAIRNAIKCADPTVERLEKEFSREADLLTKSINRTFYFSTRLHVSAPADFWLPVEVFGIRLVLTHDLPPNLSAESYFVSGFGDVDPHEPDGGVFCVGQVAARSGFAASDIAAEQLATVLGALNFWLNLHVIGSMKIGKAEVVAPLPSGSQIVLYREDYSIEKDAFSYYTHVNHRVKSLASSSIRHLAGVNTLIKSLAARNEDDQRFYRHVFRRYFDCTNEIDSDSQIIGLWTLAEYITFAIGGRSEAIADRLAVTWSDRDFVSAVCFAAGHRRNMVIHGPVRGVRLREVAEQFRGLVEQFVWRSLATNIEDVAHWKALIELLTDGSDIQQIERALPLAKMLRDIA